MTDEQREAARVAELILQEAERVIAVGHELGGPVAAVAVLVEFVSRLARYTPVRVPVARPPGPEVRA